MNTLLKIAQELHNSMSIAEKYGDFRVANSDMNNGASRGAITGLAAAGLANTNKRFSSMSGRKRIGMFAGAAAVGALTNRIRHAQRQKSALNGLRQEANTVRAQRGLPGFQ